MDETYPKDHFVAAKYGSEAVFCILFDNHEQDLRYLDKKASSNISEFNDLISRHRSFIWPSIYEEMFHRKNVVTQNKIKPEKGNYV